MGDTVGRLDFASPWLLLAAPLALLLLWFARRRSSPAIGFSSEMLVAELPGTWRTRFVWLPGALVVVGVVLAAIALARPRLGDEQTVVRSEGIAIELVIDTSSSMLAHDFTDARDQPTDRLSAVKAVVRSFVEGGDDLPGRGSDLVGLTVFAGYADATCPLTLDHRLLLESLDAAEIAQTREEDGTSIGLGLAVALGRLRETDVASRIVVLLTDGEDNDPENDPRAAAQVAADLGVRVYTVGMGSQGSAPYPRTLKDGRVVFTHQPTSLDERLLTDIAESTGGVYQRAGNTESLRRIYAAIDRLERAEIEGLSYRRWRELFALPLSFAGVLWVLAFLLEATLLRRLGS